MSTCLSFNWPVAVLVNGAFVPLNASCTNRAITCWAVYNNTKSTVQIWRHDDDDDSETRVTWHMIILPRCCNLGFQLCCITKRRHTSLPSSAKSFVVWLFFRYGSDFAWSTKQDGKHLKIEDFTRLNWLEWLRQACTKISMRTTAAVTQMMKDQVSYLAAMFTTAKALAGNTAFWNRTPFPAFVSGGNNQDPIYKVESSDHFTGVFFPSPPPCIQYKHKINMGCCMSYEQEV